MKVPSARRIATVLVPLLLLPMFTLLDAAPAAASALPPGFAETTVAGQLNNPTGISLLPDGRVLVTEQGGRLRLVKNGSLLSTPVVTVTVNRTSEAGLGGVTVDPSFATNGFVYLYYTATTPNPHNRVSRFTMVGDTASPASEVVLLDIDDLTGFQHNGGAMRFGPDGKLYVAVGDNYTATNAQSLTTLKGKVLRINPDGTAPGDNPFVATTSGIYRSIWAVGLRNPYTFDFQPGTGRMFINDVGEQSWEEINEGRAGANYGWPATEGYTSDPAYDSPVHAYPHAADTSGGCAITGGAFYNPSTAQFPSEYLGRYFFVDFCNGWMKTLDTASGSVEVFATDLGAQPLMPTVAPDGSMYYISRLGDGGLGFLQRISFTGSLAPSIGTQPQSQLVSDGHSATFSVSASGNAPLTYQWSRDGLDITGATEATYTTPVLTMADDGATLRVRVSNSHGTVTSTPAIVTMTADQPPSVSITTPASGDLWQAGQTISYSGVATDPELGALPPSAYSWTVELGHRSHRHPFMAPTSGSSGSFTIPTIGETDDQVYYRVILTATDSAGLTSTTYRDIFPQTIALTVTSSPPGLLVTVDGTPRTTPYTTTAVVGLQRSLGAYSPQVVSGTSWAFASWSDGGAQTHAVLVPSADTTYTATFSNAVTGSISASPNPIQVCSGTTGVTSLTWTTTNTTTVEVHINSPAGPTFASTGSGTVTRTTGSWVDEGMVFYLQNTSGGLPLTPANTIATVTAHVTSAGCLSGSLSASPNPIQVCSGTTGVTTLSWNSQGTTAVEVRIGSPSGPTFAVSGPGPQSATTGSWVDEGMTFYLQNTSGGLPLTAANTLASTVVSTTVAGCPAAGTITASPNPIPVCDGSGVGITTLAWTSTGASRVEVRIGSPSGAVFATTGPGSRSALTGKWVNEGMTFYLQNTSGGLPLTAANTLATVVAHTTRAGCPPGGIAASPNPIQVCDGTTLGTTKVTWDSTVSKVEVHLNAPNGSTFAKTGSGPRSKTTGKWVSDGMTFYLQDVSNGKPLTAANTLATVTVRLTVAGCTASGSISANPNPIVVCDGTGTGITTVAWSSAGTSSVEVHVGSPTGPVFASGGTGSRSSTTGKWVTNGTVFYLQNTTGGLPLTPSNTLATATVSVTSAGC